MNSLVLATGARNIEVGQQPSGIKTFEKSMNLYTQPQSGPKWDPSKTYTLPFYFILLALV